jgi:hypothetical protein
MAREIIASLHPSDAASNSLIERLEHSYRQWRQVAPYARNRPPSVENFIETLETVKSIVRCYAEQIGYLHLFIKALKKDMPITHTVLIGSLHASADSIDEIDDLILHAHQEYIARHSCASTDDPGRNLLNEPKGLAALPDGELLRSNPLH